VGVKWQAILLLECGDPIGNRAMVDKITLGGDCMAIDLSEMLAGEKYD
jgi:hypothetical protein